MPLPPSTHADSSVHELLLLVLSGGVRREDARGAGPRGPALHHHHLLRRPQPRRARVRRARRPWWRRRGARPPPLICGLWGTQLHAAAHSSESRSATASTIARGRRVMKTKTAGRGDRDMRRCAYIYMQKRLICQLLEMENYWRIFFFVFSKKSWMEKRDGELFSCYIFKSNRFFLWYFKSNRYLLRPSKQLIPCNFLFSKLHKSCNLNSMKL